VGEKMVVREAGRAMSWSVLSKIATFSAGFVSSIFIIRMLGQDAWGTLSILKTINGLALVIIMLGLGNSILRFIPRSKVKGGMKELVGRYLKLFLLQVTVWIVLIALVRYRSARIAEIFGGDSDKFGFLLQVAITFVIFEVFISLLTKLMQSLYDVKILTIATLLGKASYITLLILFIKFGWGILGVLVAAAIVNVGMSLIVIPRLTRRILEQHDKTKGHIPNFATLLGFSLPFVATGLLNQIVWRRSEVLFLGHYHSSGLAGIFTLSYDIPQMLLEFIPLTIWPIVMAGTSEVYSKNYQDLPEAIDVYYRLLFILVIPVAAMGFAFVRPIIPIIYGDAMMASARFAQLFFVVFSYSFIYTPLSMSLYVIGKSWVNMVIFAILAVLNVGLDFALIPDCGLWGAFLPVAVVLALGVGIFWLVTRRYNPGIKLPVSFIGRCYLAGMPAALMAISTMKFDSLLALLLQIPVALLLLFYGFKLMRIIGEREKELILKLPIPMKERIISLF
jgi:O-antigen/teichoic acid export membrane protein